MQKTNTSSTYKKIVPPAKFEDKKPNTDARYPIVKADSLTMKEKRGGRRRTK